MDDEQNEGTGTEETGGSSTGGSDTPSSSASDGGDMAAGGGYRCPFCEAEISATAQKCKHCGEWLSEQPPEAPAGPTSYPPPEGAPYADGPGVAYPATPYATSGAGPHPGWPAAGPMVHAPPPGPGPYAMTPAPHVMPAPHPAPVHVSQAAMVHVHASRPPGSVVFAVITLLLYIFAFPVGVLLNLIGLFTGPRRGCFVSMLLVFVVLPALILLGVALAGASVGVPFIDDLLLQLH